MLKMLLWGLHYISNSFLDNIFESGCLPLVTKYLCEDEITLAFPALKIIGNIVASNKKLYIDEVLKVDNALQRLFDLCLHERETVRAYAGNALSNIVAGGSDHIETILQKPAYVRILQESLQRSGDKCKYQISCVFSNLASKATPTQIEDLVQNYNYFDYLSSIMRESDLGIYERNLIESINQVFKADQSGHLVSMFEKKGLLEQMREISGNLSPDMKVIAENIVKQYFDRQDDDDSDIVVPTTTTVLTNNMVREVVTFTQALSSQETEIVDSGTPSNINPVSRTQSSKKIKKTRKSPNRILSPKQQKIQAQRKRISQAVKQTPNMRTKKRNGRVLKRTNTMKAVIKEAKDLIKGITGRLRQRTPVTTPIKVKKASKKVTIVTPRYDADEERSVKKESNLVSNSKKISKKVKVARVKRTNSMNQTLGEAKGIIKQLDKQLKNSAKKEKILN